MKIRIKAFNPQIFLEILCCLIFSGLMIYLVISEKYLSYVTPKMRPYLYFTAIIMFIWALAGLKRLFRPRNRIRSSHCLVLAIPILVILLPHSALGLSDISSNYTRGNIFSSGAESNQPPETDPVSTPEFTPFPAITSGTQDELYYQPPKGLDEENKKITVHNDDFASWLSEIYMNLNKYEGYTISITGFVYKDSDMAENQFLPARPAMTCCVADLIPCGLLCEYEKASELKTDTWVTVEGVIFIGDYMGYKDPQIKVTSVAPAEPVEGYIYLS